MDNPGKSAPLVIGFVGQLPFLVQYSSIFFGKNVPGRNYGNYRDTKMSDRDL